MKVNAITTFLSRWKEKKKSDFVILLKGMFDERGVAASRSSWKCGVTEENLGRQKKEKESRIIKEHHVKSGSQKKTKRKLKICVCFENNLRNCRTGCAEYVFRLKE